MISELKGSNISKSLNIYQTKSSTDCEQVQKILSLQNFV